MLKPKSRALEAATVLRNEALTRGPGSRLSSVRELSARLGFSQASLSAALSNLELEGVVVRRHGSGIYAASKPPACHVAVAIASPFLLNRNQSPFWNLVLNRLMTSVAEREWECTCHVGTVSERGGWPTNEEKLELSSGLMAEISRRKPCGLISLGLTRPEILAAKQAGATVVSFAGYGQIMLSTDLASVTEQGLRALESRGSGPIKIAPCERYSHPMVLKGIESAGSPDAEPIKFFRDRSEHKSYLGKAESQDEIEDPVVTGREWMHSMAGSQPFRLISLDDMFTLGVLEAMNELDLNLGKDVTIATHSNKRSPVLSCWECSLIRMEIDPEGVAAQLLDLVGAATQLGGWDKVAEKCIPAEVLPDGELIYRTPAALILPGSC